MDGTLVDNSPVHVRAFEIFCARYGVTDWKAKLADSFGMGNDDIMRAVMPAEIIREKGLAALAEEKEAIYREIYAPDIHPVEGLVELLERLRAAGVRCAVGSSGCKANVDFVLEKCAIGPYFRREGLGRHGHALQTRPGNLSHGGRRAGRRPCRLRGLRGRQGRLRIGQTAVRAVSWP